jgi:hypothetical protein
VLSLELKSIFKMLTSSIVIISITLFHFTKSQELYGLTRAKNNNQTCSGAPSGCTQLVSISSQTGTIKNIGIPVQTLAAVGDLGAIDSWNGIYYFLGDGWNGTGTVLVALSLNDGSEMCKTNLNDRIKTVGVVGGEMSLNIIQKKSICHRIILFKWSTCHPCFTTIFQRMPFI